MSAGGSLRPEPSGAYLRSLLDVDFTDDQLAIATHELSPQLVIAGAGSGKTMVMAARVVHAVAYQRISAGQILGLTFTNKAAGELATRVRRSLARLEAAGLLTSDLEATGSAPDADGGDLGNDSGADSGRLDDLPTVSTYHSYAATIVRDHALRIGREPGAVLMSEAARWQLATKVVRAARGPFEHLTLAPPTVVNRVLGLSGEIAEHLVDVEAVRRADTALIAAIEGLPGKLLKASTDALSTARMRGDLLDLVEAYTAEKERLDLIDFGDQVALAARIASEAPIVGAMERRRFGLVVLDEYQDTGVAQRLLLASLFGGGHPVVAVGDPNQAIYGWRGASMGNLLRFGQHFPDAHGQAVEAQPLMRSFRCGGRILAAANILAGRIGEHAPTRRPPLAVPELSAEPQHADTGEVVIARLDTDLEEADWIARRFAQEAAEGTAQGEMAVLVRRRSDFPRLHRALVERGLAVEVVGLGGLLQMPEVADIVSVLATLEDPAANPAAIRLLTGPRWRIGVRDLAALGSRAAHLSRWTPDRPDEPEPAVSDGLDAALTAATAQVDPVDVASLLDALESPGRPERYSAEAFDRFRRLRAELAGLRRLVGQPLVELVAAVVRTTGLDVEIESEPPAISTARAANVAAFMDHAARFTGLEGESDLGAFLAYLEAAEQAEDGLDAGGVAPTNTVKLLTVHKAKGLEWDVVAVPTMLSDVFPGRSRSPWTRAAHVLPSPLRGDASDLPILGTPDKPGLEALDEETRLDAKDEERRLAYVAFTRPRRLLLASAYCWAATRKRPCQPSPYLEELRELDTATVDQWCDSPDDDAAHPMLDAEVAEIAWPRPPDLDRLRQRRAAAEKVRVAIGSLRSDGAVGNDPFEAGAPVESTGDDWRRQAQLIVDELRRERSPVQDVLLPRRLSASQVVMLAHDPDELARSIARPVPVRPVAQARRGSRFHAWVESLWQASPLLDTEDLPGAGDADLTDAELSALQDRFLAEGWGERRPIAVEQPFELVVAGRLLRGRIDAVYGRDANGSISSTGDTSGGWDVVDYKTGAVPRDFAAASLQLAIYRLAWADLVGADPQQVNAAFLYVRTGTLKRPEQLLDRAQLASLLTKAG